MVMTTDRHQCQSCGVFLLLFFAIALLQSMEHRQLVLSLLQDLDDKVQPSCNAPCFQNSLQ